jgi:hypothetical protein
MADLTDKAPLKEYLTAILEGVLGAMEAVEKAHPGWEVGATTINVKAALRPDGGNGQKVTVWADMDVSHSELVSEIPISLRRNPDAGKPSS